ncbi:hypothetical protein ACF0H5_004670 [Mactra antiquata]
MAVLKGILSSIVLIQVIVKSTDAVLCYKCDHVAHPRDCASIMECADGEVCNVISYAQPDGHFYYKTGCKQKSACPLNAVGKKDIAFCNRCCTDDYCNKELCDLKSTATHGPRCLQCTTVEHPTHCGAVTECNIGEVCYTMEKYVFGELRYQMGCALPGCTPRSRRDIFDKRASSCQQCCTGENCNRQLCLNTGSALTQAPGTIPSLAPTTAAPVTSAPVNTQPPAPTTVATPKPTTKVVGMTNPTTATTSKTTFHYNLRGCHYRGKVYHVNDTWDEGCDFKCTCIDDRTGRYRCQDICPTYLNVPKECKMVKPDGECCSHPDCSGAHIHLSNFTSVNYTGSITLNNCYYNGQTYQQDEKWRDGCDYECQCFDASRGYYRCQSLCYTWNLPDACHLNDPAPGKCCKTPSCPGGYVINYPQGYVEN